MSSHHGKLPRPQFRHPRSPFWKIPCDPGGGPARCHCAELAWRSRPSGRAAGVDVSCPGPQADGDPVAAARGQCFQFLVFPREPLGENTPMGTASHGRALRPDPPRQLRAAGSDARSGFRAGTLVSSFCFCFDDFSQILIIYFTVLRNEAKVPLKPRCIPLSERRNRDAIAPGK